MKIYIVGDDGSGGEYGPSITVQDFHCPDEKWGADYTKAFLSLEKAKEYYQELTDKGYYMILAELEVEDAEK